MKLIESKPYLWIAPLLILISGILSVFNENINEVMLVLWYILMAICAIMIFTGIKSHIKYSKNKSKKR